MAGASGPATTPATDDGGPVDIAAPLAQAVSRGVEEVLPRLRGGVGWGYNRKRVDREELWKIVSRVLDKGLFCCLPG
jgi:hypothetical protein